MEPLKTVYNSTPKGKPKEQNKPLPVDGRTVWNIQKHDPTGRAVILYLFYVQKAVDQNSPQPWAIDSFCARRLRWDIKTARKARQALEASKVITLIQKRRSNYVRVHYLTDKIKGPSINMQTENIPEAFMGSPIVLDYFSKWLDNIKFHKNFSRFISEVQKKLGRKVDDMDVANKMEKVWDKIIDTGYGTWTVNNEKSFYAYMVTSVVNKFKEKN